MNAAKIFPLPALPAHASPFPVMVKSPLFPIDDPAYLMDTRA